MAKTAVAQKQADTSALRLKVTLLDTKPPIWRRILMSGRMTLEELHVVIQVTMGWDGGHLHAFNAGEQRYGDPTIIDDIIDESRMTLNGLLQSGVTRFTYTYDFGDDWQHEIRVEKPPIADAAPALPACTGGKRHCPPEDCGGPWGYADLLDILADPAHPQHAEQLEWLDRNFDPEAFSVVEADAALAEVFKRNMPRQIKPLGRPVTAKSCKPVVR